MTDNRSLPDTVNLVNTLVPSKDTSVDAVNGLLLSGP